MGGPVATDAQGNVYVTGNTNSVDFPSTTGSRNVHQPPLIAFSNGGQTATPLLVGSQVSVTAIGGTSDGKVLYVATPDGIFVSGNNGASFVQAAPLVGPYGGRLNRRRCRQFQWTPSTRRAPSSPPHPACSPCRLPA
jgi:hypothetical protein